MVQVNIISGDVEQALRALKRKLQREVVFRSLKNKRYFEKPSVKGKRKSDEARTRSREIARRIRTADDI